MVGKNFVGFSGSMAISVNILFYFDFVYKLPFSTIANKVSINKNCFLGY